MPPVQYQRDGESLRSKGETCVRDLEAFLLSRESASTLLHYPRRAYNAYIFKQEAPQSIKSILLALDLSPCCDAVPTS